MNYTIDLNHMPDYVLARTEGEPTAHEFENMLKEIVASADWKIGTDQVIDHRKLDIDRLTSNDMRDIVNRIKKYSRKLGNGRCAFVINGVLGYGIARMYELMGGEALHRDIGIFYTIEDALDWLKRNNV